MNRDGEVYVSDDVPDEDRERLVDALQDKMEEERQEQLAGLVVTGRQLLEGDYPPITKERIEGILGTPGVQVGKGEPLTLKTLTDAIKKIEEQPYGR